MHIWMPLNWFLIWTLFHIFIFNSDSLADADMAEGVPKTSSILKIGFLFDHVSETYENEIDLNHLFI